MGGQPPHFWRAGGPGPCCPPPRWRRPLGQGFYSIWSFSLLAFKRRKLEERCFPRCFFFKDTLHCVCIDLKRSPSNLTLGQCKRSWNCVKFYIIRLVLIGQMSLDHFVATLDQKVISTNDTNAAYEKTFLIYSRNKKTHIFVLRFFRYLRIVAKTNSWCIWNP